MAQEKSRCDHSVVGLDDPDFALGSQHDDDAAADTNKNQAQTQTQHQTVGDDTLMSREIVENAKAKRPLAFYFTFFAINIIVFVFSLDATSLAVAIPVRPTYETSRFSCSL